MESLPKRRVVPTAVVLGLVAVLAVLAVLQYRWSREVSEAASERMKASVHASLMGLRHDFFRELAAVCAAFHGDPGTKPRDWANYVEAFQAWSRKSASGPVDAKVASGRSTLSTVCPRAVSIGNLTAQMTSIHAKADAAFYQILTPDQQGKLSQLQKQGPGHGFPGRGPGPFPGGR